jgi:hypothetical protein
MAETPFGPRASIAKIGMCEEMSNGDWAASGWIFDPRGEAGLLDRGCPFVHDEQERHVGYLGWRWTELKAIADAQIELSMLESAERGQL